MESSVLSKSELAAPAHWTEARRPRRTRPAQAKYDAAQTTSENSRHWLQADHLSANAANSAFVRRILRNRSRYEVGNNSYASAMVKTMAYDVVGTGPRLQLLTPDKVLNKRVETSFRDWADEIRLAAKLRTMRMTRAVDGEVFAVKGSNRTLQSKIKLDLRLLEGDQVADPNDIMSGANPADGITLDRYGNPKEYKVLRTHPGDTFMPSTFDFDVVPARSMIHWYRVDRPAQLRGIPETTPALSLFSQLRRYILAILAAAETAADFAAVLYSDGPATQGDTPDPMDVIELERRMATVLPEGWKLGQMKPDAVTPVIREFKREMLTEAFRCMLMPYNIGAGDSSDHNYASGRLDGQGYNRVVTIDRDDCRVFVLHSLMHTWFDLASLVGILPRELFEAGPVPHAWFWDGRGHDDPVKEEKAIDMRLGNRTSSYAREFAARGLDWEEEFAQIAKEQEMMQRLKITPGQVSSRLSDESDETDEDDLVDRVLEKVNEEK